MIDTTVSRRRTEQPDPTDIYVGGRLRLRRNLIGMSQEHLGKASGLTFQQIQKYERGVNRMGASRLYQLAQILNVPVAYFFDEMPVANTTPETGPGFSDNPQAPIDGMSSNDNEILQRRETMEVIRAYYKITDPKQRRKMLELMKTMAD